jgi:hypothetical protein
MPLAPSIDPRPVCPVPDKPQRGYRFPLVWPALQAGCNEWASLCTSDATVGPLASDKVQCNAK